MLVNLLNAALAAELVRVRRYDRHYRIASGLNARTIAREFLQHAKEDRANALLIAERIVQIGGEPEFSTEGPDGPDRETEIGMIEENLLAASAGIESYRSILAYLGDQDPTTRRMTERILAMEEAHADDLRGLVKGLAA